MRRDRRSHAASAGLQEAHAASAGLREAASPRAPPLGSGACGMHDEIAAPSATKSREQNNINQVGQRFSYSIEYSEYTCTSSGSVKRTQKIHRENDKFGVCRKPPRLLRVCDQSETLPQKKRIPCSRCCPADRFPPVAPFTFGTKGDYSRHKRRLLKLN